MFMLRDLNRAYAWTRCSTPHNWVRCSRVPDGLRASGSRGFSDQTLETHCRRAGCVEDVQNSALGRATTRPVRMRVRRMGCKIGPAIDNRGTVSLHRVGSCCSEDGCVMRPFLNGNHKGTIQT